MAEYKSREDAIKKLQKARNKYAKAREVYQKNRTDKNKAKMDAALKECKDIQHVLDRWF